MPKSIPITVVEVPEFLSLVRKLMSEEEHDALVDYVAYNPTAGDLMVGTGGLAEAAGGLWPGGARAGERGSIYYYHNVGLPLFLLTAYAKNDRGPISARQTEMRTGTWWTRFRRKLVQKREESR